MHWSSFYLVLFWKSPLVSWSETVFEINHLIPLSNWSWSQSMSAISVSILIILNPVLICNQLVQSTITPVCKTCLINMLKYKYHLDLSIKFVIIKTLHPMRWIQQNFWPWNNINNIFYLKIFYRDGIFSNKLLNHLIKALNIRYLARLSQLRFS